MGGGYSFPGLISPNDAVNFQFVVGIKPGDFSVVIGYQADEFTYTWLVEHVFTQLHIALESQAKCQH